MALSLTSLNPADFPSAAIANGRLHVEIYLPDRKSGFYQGTRFDWSGVIHTLRFEGHDYYGPWFTKTDPSVHDFVYRGDDIVAGPCSAITGPVDEFKPLGWEQAKSGGSFVKIGIGALRKPDDQPYDQYRLYEVADPGTWVIRKNDDSITFVQTLDKASSGFGYVYSKSVRLTPGRPEMILHHSIRNTGQRAIETTVYNHNFLVLDGKSPGPGLTITVPFAIQSPHPPEDGLAAIRGKQIAYLKELKDHDTVTASLDGFGPTSSDHHVQIENTSRGAGMTIQGDHPLVSAALWSIRTVVAVEPFIRISVEPGKEFAWTSTYEFYSLPAAR